jgi:outer membrane biosynthesis protein TonB
MTSRAAVAATALAACLLAASVSAAPGVEPQHAEADARAARRELMRQFAEQVVALVRTRLHGGIDYPAEALANRWEGTVWLAILYL